jgi:hypothetical protein
MGAVQLRQFGAQIYVADLVGSGMAREMGAIMTGVIVAGLTGAAFAAQLGTMQVNEEINALWRDSSWARGSSTCPWWKKIVRWAPDSGKPPGSGATCCR